MADEAEGNAANRASPSEPKTRPPFDSTASPISCLCYVQQVCIGVAEGLDQAGRALDVREQERRRLRRRPVGGRGQNSSSFRS